MRTREVGACLVLSTALLGLLVRQYAAPSQEITPHKCQDCPADSVKIELSELRSTNIALEQKIFQLQQALSAQKPLVHTVEEPVTNSEASVPAEASFAAHRVWDWKAIVLDLLQHWPTVAQSQLESGVEACHNSSMYCQRMQIHDGKLYLTDYRAIFFGARAFCTLLLA